MPAPPQPEPGFSYLFDGITNTFQCWRNAGSGAFGLQDGLLIAQPGDDHGILFYAAEAFNDFVLRLQFRLPGPVDAFGKATSNSGVLLRFRYPHARWDEVNRREPRAAGNPAWVAVTTGFEVQIDEQGRPFYYEKHRTGALYDIPTGQTINGLAEPVEQKYSPGPVLQPDKWYEFEIEVVGDAYTVSLGEVQAGQQTAHLPVTSFTKPADKYLDRGLPASAKTSSGYIGLQAHTSNVAFRQIRTKRL
ncbi:3-keto-disaccharide hydrolase [Actinomadura rudentiformis]|uniref:3-keto-disaccharide hydrolase n=1 Tax=Actinomadura rudentiformis TaxID=359158 RepID=UPI00178C4BE9|nr:DUF1080 domain-containing protein [Actinomadura rudentiformis]